MAAKPDIGTHLTQLGNVALYGALGKAQALGQLGGCSRVAAFNLLVERFDLNSCF